MKILFKKLSVIGLCKGAVLPTALPQKKNPPVHRSERVGNAVRAGLCFLLHHLNRAYYYDGDLKDLLYNLK